MHHLLWALAWPLGVLLSCFNWRASALELLLAGAHKHNLLRYRRLYIHVKKVVAPAAAVLVHIYSG